MNKKVMAVAVAGAFALPAGVALAQTSTVQIGGSVTFLYSSYRPNNSSSAKNGDILESSEPNIYVRGEEKLGGGLSAWFQCESSFDEIGGAATATGFCTRNSAVGMKGAYGNLFFGNWDMPYKLVGNNVRGPWSFTNTLLGGSGRLLEGATASGLTNPVLGGGGFQGTAAGGTPASFLRRQANSIFYHSPSWNGFRLEAGYSATNESTGLPTTNPLKPRMHSLAAEYSSGPLWVGAAFERHTDFNPGATAVSATGAASTYTGGTDESWTIGARYTFGGVFRLAGRYTKSEYEPTQTTTLETDGWAIHGEWRIQGPHTIGAQYARLDDPSGNSVMSVSTYRTTVAAGGLGTGANMWSLHYWYDFSKRTRVGLGYNKLNPDAGAFYTIGKAAPTIGGSQRSIGISAAHRF